MRIPAAAKWIGLALLGLMIAVAVAVAASHLVSQQIGIASESISAGDSLAPAVGSVRPPESGVAGDGNAAGTGRGEPGTTTAEPPPEETGSGGDEDRSSSDDSGGGEGSDD